MKKIIFIFLIASFFTECKKSNDDFSTNLIGEWSWFKSCGGFAGGCRTQLDSNQKIRIVFTNNSLYNQYINDTLQRTSNYNTYQITPKFSSTKINIVEFDQSGIQYSFLVKHDTLFLNDYSMSDGYMRYYKRIK